MGTTLAELKRSPLYSEQLGIDPTRDEAQELFKWFFASLLFGGHISESIAGHTYQAFAAHGLLTPQKNTWGALGLSRQPHHAPGRLYPL